MKTIQYRQKAFTIPTCWDDLSLAQQEIAISRLRPLADRILMDVGGKKEIVSADVVRQTHIIALQLLLGLKNEFFEIPVEYVHDLIFNEKVTEFIFKEPGPLTLKNRRWKGLAGPGPKLTDTTAEELFTALQFYKAWKAGPDKMLLPFLAVFFRPVKGDKRAAFQLDNVHTREKKIASMPAPQKLLAVAWFEANLERIYQANPHLAGSSKSSGSGHFIELFLQMAKDGPFGDFEKTRAVNAEIFFMEMNLVLKEQADFEQKHKKK